VDAGLRLASEARDLGLLFDLTIEQDPLEQLETAMKRERKVPPSCGPDP